MTDAIHHLHKRKRFHKHSEQFPHPNKFKRYLDRIVYIAGIVGPLMSIPQVTKIWVHHNASSISLVTFTSNMLLNTIMITYGITHREKPIIVMYIMWLLINSLIVSGTLLYG